MQVLELLFIVGTAKAHEVIGRRLHDGAPGEIRLMVKIKKQALLMIFTHQQFGQVFPLRNVDDVAVLKINPRTRILAQFQKQKPRLV